MWLVTGIFWSCQMCKHIWYSSCCTSKNVILPSQFIKPFSFLSACQYCVICHFLMLSQILVPFTGLPSPPRTPSFTIQQYGQDNVMLTVHWQSPQDGGGAPVNYTITVSPVPTEVTTSSTSAPLSAVPYNVISTITIVATNCNGSSSAVMETIRIGRLQYSLWSTWHSTYTHWKYYLP